MVIEQTRRKAYLFDGENWQAFRCILYNGTTFSQYRPIIGVSDSPVTSGTSAILGKAILGRMILGKGE